MKKFLSIFVALIMVLTLSFSLVGCAGEAGPQGEPGIQGEKGEQGEKGDPGVGIAKVEIVDGSIVITYTDGKVENLGALASNEGTQGLEYYPLPDGTYGVRMGTTQYLEEVTIPAIYNGKAVTKILDGAFRNAVNLKVIHIPNSVISIGYNAFSGCSSLASITIPNSVTSMCDYAFSGCSSLASITIPDGVTSIGYSAFSGCSLKDVYYTGSEADKNEITISYVNDPLLNATWHYNYVPIEN